MNKHCWHGTGMTFTSYPPQYPKVCCKCGARATLRVTLKQVLGHGRFVPDSERTVMHEEPLPEGPCTGSTTTEGKP
jgi:hypothetical protein